MFVGFVFNSYLSSQMKNLQYLPRSLEAREVLFEDRTKAHADHVGHGLDRMTTGAVGILKAVRCGEKTKVNRITKVRSNKSTFLVLLLKIFFESSSPVVS